MTNGKLTFLPSLLISILLFTTSNLKLGNFLNSFFAASFYPLSAPLSNLKAYYQSQINTIKNLPNTNKQNREQKVFIAHLVRENELLKQTLKDSKVESNLKNNYQEVLAIKVSGSRGKIVATSTQDLDKLKSGMPVVNGNILLGMVTEVNQNIINIISLEDDLFPPLNLKSASGPEGVYRHHNGIPQIVNVPSQTPIILGDFVLTNPTDQIPANLLVGKVSKVTTSPQDPLQKGEVTLYDSFSNNPDNIVIILKP